MGHVGPTDKENQVKIYKKSTVLGTLPLWNGKDPDPDPYQTVGSRSVSNWKQDPDPYQKGLDRQHWLHFKVAIPTTATYSKIHE